MQRLIGTIAGYAALVIGCAGDPVDDELGEVTQLADEDPFALRVITSGLEAPWEITLGPDGMLWVTERVGKRIVRIDPASGARTTLVTIEEANPIGGQEGVLGMALEASGDQVQHVYVAFTY